MRLFYIYIYIYIYELRNFWQGQRASKRVNEQVVTAETPLTVLMLQRNWVNRSYILRARPTRGQTRYMRRTSFSRVYFSIIILPPGTLVISPAFFLSNTYITLTSLLFLRCGIIHSIYNEIIILRLCAFCFCLRIPIGESWGIKVSTLLKRATGITSSYFG